MNSLTQTVALLGIVTAAITIITALVKALVAISNLRTKIAAIDWRIEAQELTINGVRERVEHLSTRLQVQVDKNAGVIEDLQAYLQKNTSYERRGNR